MARRSLAFDLLIGAVAFAFLALLPVVWPSKALVDFVIRGAALGLFATSLNVLVGYGGMVSFGHGMFFGLGAYSFALLMQRTGMPIPAAFGLTLVLCAALGLIVGAICVRLKEIYFAFLTLAFQMLLHSLIILWTPLTGGDQGLRRVPAKDDRGTRGNVDISGRERDPQHDQGRTPTRAGQGLPALHADDVGRILDRGTTVRAHRPAVVPPDVLLRDRRRRDVVVWVGGVRQVGATPEADQVLRLHPDAAVWAGQDRHLLALRR